MPHTTVTREAFLVWQRRPGNNEYHPCETYERVGEHDTDHKFSQLADLYWNADPELRSEIREFFEGATDVLMAMWQYVRRAAVLLRSTGDGIWLRRGLAVAAIENARWDYRDSMNSIAILRYAAERAGIDPRSEFEAATPLCHADGQRFLTSIVDWADSVVCDSVRAFGPPDWREEIEQLNSRSESQSRNLP